MPASPLVFHRCSNQKQAVFFSSLQSSIIFTPSPLSTLASKMGLVVDEKLTESTGSFLNPTFLSLLKKSLRLIADLMYVLAASFPPKI